MAGIRYRDVNGDGQKRVFIRDRLDRSHLGLELGLGDRLDRSPKRFSFFYGFGLFHVSRWVRSSFGGFSCLFSEEKES